MLYNVECIYIYNIYNFYISLPLNFFGSHNLIVLEVIIFFTNKSCLIINWASLVAQLVKNLLAMQETPLRSLGWEDSPGGGNGNPLQYSCLGNPMDSGTWWAIIHGVAESDMT